MSFYGTDFLLQETDPMLEDLSEVYEAICYSISRKQDPGKQDIRRTEASKYSEYVSMTFGVLSLPFNGNLKAMTGDKLQWETYNSLKGSTSDDPSMTFSHACP